MSSMTSRSSRPEDVIRAAIAGEPNWAELAALGVEIDETVGRVSSSSPIEIPTLAPSTRDVARGYVVACGNGNQRLWAGFMMTALFIDLSALGTSNRGDRLLSALWDAAAGKEPTPQELRLGDELSADET